MILPIAYAVAVAATLLLIRHLALRYPSVPKRVPVRIGIDGRPSKRMGPKALLWLAPGILAAAVAVLGVALASKPPLPSEQFAVALALATIAVVAWFTAWLLDRHIEIARKMSYRLAPVRLLAASAPVLIMAVAVLVIAFRG